MDIQLSPDTYAEVVAQQGHPSVEVVRAELERMIAEREAQEYWVQRNVWTELAKQLTIEERIKRRRLVAELTRKQKAIGERILRELIDQGRGDEVLRWHGQPL